MICDYPVETATIREKEMVGQARLADCVPLTPPFHVTSDVFLDQSGDRKCWNLSVAHAVTLHMPFSIPV